jgi:hypothetical protein
MQPLGCSDHKMIFMPSTTITRPEKDYCYKRKITPSARMAIQSDINAINWETITQLQNPHQQAEELQSTILQIVDKHCTIKRVKRAHNSKPWFDALARKLHNAKIKAYRKGCPSAKRFGILLRNHIRKIKRKWISNSLDSNNHSCMWQVINTLNGNKQSKSKPCYLLNNEFLNQKQTAEKLNTYFSTIGGEPSQIVLENITNINNTNPALLTVTTEQVRNWLSNINTKKATCSLDYPSWVSRMCTDELSHPLSVDINNCFSKCVFLIYGKLQK